MTQAFVHQAFDPSVVQEPALRALYAYWADRAGARPMPARGDLDPIDIPTLLPKVILVDLAERLDDFRFRLCGTGVVRGFKHDRTGVTLGALRPDLENSDEVYAGYWRCYQDAEPDYFHGRVVSSAMEHRRYSRLLLPLSRDGQRVDMIFGGFVFYVESDEKGR